MWYYNSISLSQKKYNEAEFNQGFNMQNFKAVFPQRLYNDENIFKKLFSFDSMFNQKILMYSILHKNSSLLLTIAILIDSHWEL